jgi:hypothetical protein
MDLVQSEHKINLMLVDIIPIRLDQSAEPSLVHDAVLVGEILEEGLEVSAFLVVDQESVLEFTQFVQVDLLVLELVFYFLYLGI